MIRHSPSYLACGPSRPGIHLPACSLSILTYHSRHHFSHWRPLRLAVVSCLVYWFNLLASALARIVATIPVHNIRLSHTLGCSLHYHPSYIHQHRMSLLPQHERVWEIYLDRVRSHLFKCFNISSFSYLDIFPCRRLLPRRGHTFTKPSTHYHDHNV